MAEEILIYRLSKSGDFTSKEVFDHHFNHLLKHGKLLFTTSSRISLKDKQKKEIIFVDDEKNRCFKAIIVGCGKFNETKTLPRQEFKVPKQFKDVLEEEKQSKYRWFALCYDRKVSCEPFKKGTYRLSRGSKVEVIDSLGNNQTPFRYVVPYEKK